MCICTSSCTSPSCTSSSSSCTSFQCFSRCTGYAPRSTPPIAYPNSPPPSAPPPSAPLSSAPLSSAPPPSAAPTTFHLTASRSALHFLFHFILHLLVDCISCPSVSWTSYAPRTAPSAAPPTALPTALPSWPPFAYRVVTHIAPSIARICCTSSCTQLWDGWVQEEQVLAGFLKEQRKVQIALRYSHVSGNSIQT